MKWIDIIMTVGIIVVVFGIFAIIGLSIYSFNKEVTDKCIPYCESRGMEYDSHHWRTYDPKDRVIVCECQPPEKEINYKQYDPDNGEFWID
jgi:hypothetical protein